MNSKQERKVAAAFSVEELRSADEHWATVFRGDEADATMVFQRQLELYSAGRFRLVGPDGHVIEDRHVQPKLVC